MARPRLTGILLAGERLVKCYDSTRAAIHRPVVAEYWPEQDRADALAKTILCSKAARLAQSSGPK